MWLLWPLRLIYHPYSMQCILYQQFMPLKSIHYKCVLTVSVVSSEDDLSPSATLCLFRQAEENELLWHVDEQNCPIFLQGHAFRPLSRKHIPLHLHTVLLSLKGSLDAWSTSLSSNCSSVWSSESSMLLLSILHSNLHLLHGSTANSTRIFLYPAALFIFL